jgi:nicotinate-nucleotide--dimethylbenzimidazole phosphoribosyltransferase
VSWSRPVPLIGDATSARERRAQPTAWAFGDDEVAAVHAVIGARRDIRRFRPDAVPAETLRRILGAAHTAPSVGHSQPWRFIVVIDPATRDRAALLADRERLRQAAQLTEEAGRRLLDLQLEGIREAPLGVVVCCDRRTPAAGVLGRATFPDTDLWSCACAIQNLWLAARAEGLGVGWVTLFDPADLARLLHLPDGVVTLGWLCVGWPDERPPSPGLERSGWSRRLPLEDVVLEERWPAPDQPSPPSPASHLHGPDQQRVVGVRDGTDRLLTPGGSLGVLDRALDRVSALRAGRLNAGTLVLVAADHPVAGLGVSAYGPHVTGDVLSAAAQGQSIGAAAARAVGLATIAVDARPGATPVPGTVEMRPRHPLGDLVATDALGGDDGERLLAGGRALGRELAAAGAVVLGEVGIGNTTVAAALASALLGLPAGETVGLGAGADSAMRARKAEVVAAAVARAQPGGRTGGGTPTGGPMALLRALGGAEVAVLAGIALGVADSGGVIVLDGLATSVAALLAVRLEPAVASHLVAGQRSREPAHGPVLMALGLEPLLDLRLRAGEGVGACLAFGLLQAAARARDATATTD